jgi:hypothetical protein
MEGKLAGGRMIVKAKDVVRYAKELVAAAQTNSRRLSSPTLRSELVPHAASLARVKYIAEFKNFHDSSRNE